MNQRVIVLLASYNGEKYIREQIESILNQTYNNICLYISDDNSTDLTRTIIDEYIQQYDNIYLISREYGGCARKNFQNLIQFALKHTSSKYVMFSDQDDIWLPDKIETEMKYMKEIEDRRDSSFPVLIYSNYYDFYNENVEKTNIVYNKAPENKFSRIVLQNWLMGCTMLLNRSLLERCAEIPEEADNHDAWIAMIGSLIGEIGYIHTPTLLHRIHSNNVTQQVNTKNINNRIKRIVKRVAKRKDYRKKMENLLFCIRNTIDGSECNIEILDELDKLLYSKGIQTYRIMKKNQFYGVNIVQNILFFLQYSLK